MLSADGGRREPLLAPDAKSADAASKAASTRKLKLAMFLTLIFMMFEIGARRGRARRRCPLARAPAPPADRSPARSRRGCRGAAGGLYAGSLAILTDAAHLLSDVAGFLVSMIALAISARPANATFSFGYHRAEVLGALLSILAVWFVTGILVYEAINRLITPTAVDGFVMGITAVGTPRRPAR
jgi:Co/Zn/Cd efflux system component